jgi:hypothetical protein
MRSNMSLPKQQQEQQITPRGKLFVCVDGPAPVPKRSSFPNTNRPESDRPDSSPDDDSFWHARTIRDGVNAPALNPIISNSIFWKKIPARQLQEPSGNVVEIILRTVHLYQIGRVAAAAAAD